MSGDPSVSDLVAQCRGMSDAVIQKYIVRLRQKLKQPAVT